MANGAGSGTRAGSHQPVGSLGTGNRPLVRSCFGLQYCDDDTHHSNDPLHAVGRTGREGCHNEVGAPARQDYGSLALGNMS